MKAFRCPYENCVRVLSTRYNLKKHIEAHHLHLKPFTCAQCQRSFSYKHTLKHHYLLHLPIAWQQRMDEVSPSDEVPTEIPRLTSMLENSLFSTAHATEKKGQLWKFPAMPFLSLPKIGKTQESSDPLPSIFF